MSSSISSPQAEWPTAPQYANMGNPHIQQYSGGYPAQPYYQPWINQQQPQAETNLFPFGFGFGFPFFGPFFGGPFFGPFGGPFFGPFGGPFGRPFF